MVPSSERPVPEPGGTLISAVELARRLGLPEPTAQQVRVIEAPVDAPALVVAGAGSGKTETMASRVVWLIANRLALPSEVLGLTFTRKAAGELRDRIERRLRQLQLLGLAPSAGDEALFDAPTVSTYNAFAAQIFRDGALRVGREAEAALLDDESAWRLARRVVIASRDERLARLDTSLSRTVDAVLELAHALTENLVEPDAVVRLSAEFADVVELPWGLRKRGPDRAVLAAADNVGALEMLVELAQTYEREKAASGLLEFSDQVALALRVVAGEPAVAEDYRRRFRVVLLDEYQDTSVVQTRLLARLFAGHGVMAVGDPNQSIYGWRGASAGNLEAFLRDFAGAESVAGSDRYALTRSWRNGRRVLAAANALVADASGGLVERLDAPDSAPEGVVAVHVAETAEEEADWLAGELGEALAARAEATAAILVRNRSAIPLLARGLERAGVRFKVLGEGGLLATPEVVDVVSVLTAAYRADGGSALIRMLAGARWRVGLRDIEALRDAARWLGRHDWRQGVLDDDLRNSLRASVDPDSEVGIVDALDAVAGARDGHVLLSGFSPEGLDRLRDVGRFLAAVRQRVGLPLGDLVRFIERELRLDIEVWANESSPFGARGRPEANLDAFHDLLDAFLAVDDLGTLGSFLDHLERLARRDAAGPRSDASEAGTVQVLTVHGSKGLEWDIVAVPRMVDDELPGKAKDTKGWLAFGKLPAEFAGDAAYLPHLAWRGAETQKDLATAIEEYTDAVKARHLEEERRLAYVAVTRAKSLLLLSASFWSTQKKPRRPSIYLRELAEAGLIDAVPEASALEENPLADTPGAVEEWPADPLGARRGRVEAAAARVRAAQAAGGATPGGRSEGRWARELELLLAERDARRAGGASVPLPTRVAASRVKDMVDDPAAAAAALRRPMPRRPFPQTRLGTRFHAWVEDRALSSAPGELDAAHWQLDVEEDDGDADRLAALQRTFEASEWGSRSPAAVELELHVVLGGTVFVCKLDAVYEVAGDVSQNGSPYDVQIVDWKTGKPPRDARDVEARQIQLAFYRLAYARWRGIDPARVDAVFYFVGDDLVVRPDRVYDEEELVRLWSSVAGSAA